MDRQTAYAAHYQRPSSGIGTGSRTQVSNQLQQQQQASSAQAHSNKVQHVAQIHYQQPSPPPPATSGAQYCSQQYQQTPSAVQHYLNHHHQQQQQQTSQQTPLNRLYDQTSTAHHQHRSGSRSEIFTDPIGTSSHHSEGFATPSRSSSRRNNNQNQNQRRHSTSRLRDIQAHLQQLRFNGFTNQGGNSLFSTHNQPSNSQSTFIKSITNNFMSFGAPFLFDWRLFCERGQPRYVHKHEGDGLRVDECEARFLSKIASEEKASSVAISDAEDDHHHHTHHHHSHSQSHSQAINRKGKTFNKSSSIAGPSTTPTGSTAAANVECLGSVRKSGFLSVKKWLIRKKTSLELARKRGWKGYWVCLKGTTLLFYRCDCSSGTGQCTTSGSGHVIEARPRHLIFVDACLVQAIPEHPKRDNVFCLSTAFGDAYLLDAPCLVERDHWLAAIHCACAAQLARSSGRATVAQVLNREICRLEESVDLDSKARQEAEAIVATALAADAVSGAPLTAVEARAKQQRLIGQIHSLEERIEKSRTEIFRFRAYLAALICEEDPNPKSLLSQTTKRSKQQLNRLGVFTVSSLHAFNCAKNPTIIGNLTRTRSADSLPHEFDLSTGNYTYGHISGTTTGGQASGIGSKEVRAPIIVRLLNGEQHRLELNASLSADQVLIKLLPVPIARDYFLRVEGGGASFKRHETVLDHAHEVLEIIPKTMFTCEMSRDTVDALFGFSVESELSQDDLRVYVSRVEPNSLAASQQLRRGDEIVVINGALVQDLDMMYVESVLQEELALCLTIRACRDDLTGNINSRSNSRLTNTTSAVGTSLGSRTDGDVPVSRLGQTPEVITDELIESLVCPPPPPIDISQMILSEKQLSKYIVPKVDSYLNDNAPILSGSSKKITKQSSGKHHHHHLSERSSRSLSAKAPSTRINDLPETIGRPHSAMSTTSGTIKPNHHHHHHHHGHHHTKPDYHHHHHHHHHHSSTKHIYHITQDSAQAQLYDLLEQTLLNQPVQPQNIQGPTSPPIIDVPIGTNDNVQTIFNEAQEQNPTNVGVSSKVIMSPQDVDTQQSTQPTTQVEGQYPVEIIQHDTQQDMVDYPDQEADAITALDVEADAEKSISLPITSYTSELTAEKIRKVVHELLDTERAYCKSLDQLMTLYLDPILKSSILSPNDCRKLVGSIPEVILTQNQFREDLQTIIAGDDLNVEAIAKCFLNYSNDFKNYSTFCASHTKAVKLMADEKSILAEFMGKHSKCSTLIGPAGKQSMYSLESYLIRPIQRILKYPLLLSQMKTLCIKDSQPYYKVNEALRAIESVAEHINEMQRINEEYGAIFEHLVAGTRSSSKKSKDPFEKYDLSPIALIHYGGVDWLNSMEFLGKNLRKSTSHGTGLNLHSMCFVFKQCVVFLCKETIRHGKSKSGKSAQSDMEIIRHQVLIPVGEVQVRACTGNGPEDELEADFKWELVQLKTHPQGKRSEKIFKLSNSTNEYRNAFLRTIRQIIREDVRRMSIISGRQASGRSETSPTDHRTLSDSKQRQTIVSFASTQNLSKCGYCGEDFSKLVKKANANS